MYKVKCVGCGNIGYTAAPHHVRCSECGGSHRIIEARMVDEPGFHKENAFLAFLTNRFYNGRRVG